MANHKRKKPKSGRSGCLLCKPQKHQRSSKESRLKHSELRKTRVAKEKVSEGL